LIFKLSDNSKMMYDIPLVQENCTENK